jgi:hypothetical protein
MSDDKNPPVRIPEDEEGDEDGVTEEQLRNLVEAQAHLIGDLYDFREA